MAILDSTQVHGSLVVDGNLSTEGKILSNTGEEVYHPGHKPTVSEIGAKPANWLPTWNDIQNKPSAYNPTAHTHNDLYYQKSESDNRYKPKEPTTFHLNEKYVGVRTASRKPGQYYEIWDNNIGWADIHSGNIFVEGRYKMYHQGFKPTPSDIGALPSNGGRLTGDVIFPNNNKIEWNRNTDFARIHFKNDSDGDTNSYMGFEVGDNGNEYFKFTSGNVEWLSIKGDHLRYKNNKVYHEGFKPTWNDIQGKPGNFTPSSHTHDDRYYQKSETDTKIRNINYHSTKRDFVNGTLIKTTIPYTDGTPWFLEMNGNSYGELIPFHVLVQGYCYNGTCINFGGLTSGKFCDSIQAFSLNGNLCFWFPRMAYWQGFNVKVIVAQEGRNENRVEGVQDVAKPSGIQKEVTISISKIYSTFNKPTANDIGALPITGGTVTGNLEAAGGKVIIGSYNYGFMGRTSTGGSDYLAYIDTDNRAHFGYNGRTVKIDSLNILNQNNKRIYHEDFKPTWNDIQGKPSSFNPSSHTHNEYVTKLPRRLRGVNLNTIYEGGFYSCSHDGTSDKNFPEVSDGYLMVMPWDNGKWCSQLFIEDVTGRVYTRTTTNADATGWSSWARSYDTNNKPSWNDIQSKPGEFNPSYHNHPKLEIKDRRNTNPTPNDMDDCALTTFFTNTYGGSWKSGITLAGWSNNYCVWQLMSGSTTSLEEDLSFRSGIGNTWNSWRRIYHEGFKPTWNDIQSKPSSFPPSSHTHTDLVVPDTRSSTSTPEQELTSPRVKFDFRANGSSGIPSGGSYSGVMSFRPYGSGSDWSGGPVHQLAFNENGNVFLRNGKSSTWNAWNKVYHSGSKPTPDELGAVNKAGDTMSGGLTTTGWGTGFKVVKNGGDLSLNITNDQARIRVGGGGTLTNNGFCIQGPGDVNWLRLNSAGDGFLGRGGQIVTRGDYGHNNGIDADKLDGLHKDVFIYGKNGTGVNTISDFNTIWKSGFYELNGETNAPEPGPSAWWWIVKLGHGSNGPDYRYGTVITGKNGTDNLYFKNATVNGTANWCKIWNDRNDGHNSGMDADTVDGKHASDFSLTSHNHDDRYYTESEINTKMLSVFKGKWEINNTVDWNTITEPGCYKVQMSSWGSTSLNGPNTYLSDLYTYGLLCVYKSDIQSENRTLQIYFPHRDDNSPILTRMLNGNGWQAWRKIGRGLNAGDVGAVNKAGDTMSGTLLIEGGRIQNRGYGKTMDMGVSQYDVAIGHSGTGKWLQLKDDGTLQYSDAKIYHERFKPTWNDVGAVRSMNGVGYYADKIYTGANTNWRRVFRIACPDRSGNGTSTSTQNYYDGASISGYIIVANRDYYTGSYDKYPFTFSLLGWGGTVRGDNPELFIYEGMPDIIRVIKLGINDYELQVKPLSAWRHLYIEFQLTGNNGTTTYQKLNYEDDTAERTVVKNNTKFDRRQDVPAWNDIKNKPSTFNPSAHNHDDRYYTESEINTKMLSVFKGKWEINNTVDWNTITEPGCYKVQMGSWGSTSLNGPNTYISNLYTYGLLCVYKSDIQSENRTLQIYFPHRDDNNPILTRMLNGNGWQAWRKIGRGLNAGDVGAVNKAGDTMTGTLFITSGGQSMHLKARDFLINDKRAMVGFNTNDGNDLHINYSGDFGNGVNIWKNVSIVGGGSLKAEGGLEAKLNPIFVPANSDLNNYKTPGMYYNPSDADSRTMSNLPVACSFSLLVEKHAGFKQTFTVYWADNPKTYVRNHYNGTWGPWVIQCDGKTGPNGLSWNDDSNGYYNRVPFVKPDGILEIGRYIDFHRDDSRDDFTVRLEAGSDRALHTNSIVTHGDIWTDKYIRIRDWYNGAGQDGRFYYVGDGKRLVTENVDKFETPFLQTNKFTSLGPIYAYKNTITADYDVVFGGKMISTLQTNSNINMYAEGRNSNFGWHFADTSGQYADIYAKVYRQQSDMRTKIEYNRSIDKLKATNKYITLDKISNVKVREFSYIQDRDNSHKLGFFAQELEKEFPLLVETAKYDPTEDILYPKDKDGNDITDLKSVDNVGISAVLWDGVQELIEKTKDQDIKIAKLTAELESLKNTINNLINPNRVEINIK